MRRAKSSSRRRAIDRRRGAFFIACAGCAAIWDDSPSATRASRWDTRRSKGGIVVRK